MLRFSCSFVSALVFFSLIVGAIPSQYVQMCFIDVITFRALLIWTRS